MKQKCQVQMGIAQYKNVATPLRTTGINTTHQLFQMMYITLFQLKRLKSYLFVCNWGDLTNKPYLAQGSLWLSPNQIS